MTWAVSRNWRRFAVETFTKIEVYEAEELEYVSQDIIDDNICYLYQSHDTDTHKQRQYSTKRHNEILKAKYDISS